MENNRITRRLYGKDGVIKEKEVWMSGKQGKWCRIGVNGGGLRGGIHGA